MKLLMKLVAVMVCVGGTTPVLAQGAAGTGADSGVTAAVTAGTLGIGPELGYRISDNVGIRGNATFLGFGTDFDVDDINYEGRLKLTSYGLMADVYPFGGHFRVSGGARINRNRVRVTASPAATAEVSFGDNVYTGTQIGQVRAVAEVKKFAPALTLGWSGAKAKGFMFGFDAGVLFQGSVRVREFTTTGALNNAGVRADLEIERRNLQDDIDDYKLYPIAQFSVGWRF